MQCRTCHRHYPRRLTVCPGCGAQSHHPITRETIRLPRLDVPKPPAAPVPWRWLSCIVALIAVQFVAWLRWFPLPPAPTTPQSGSHLGFLALYTTVWASLMLIYTLRAGTWRQRAGCLAVILFGWMMQIFGIL